MPRQNNFMVAPTLVGHRLGGTTSSHHGRWSDVQGRGITREGFVPRVQNKVELVVPNDGMKCFGSFVDKAFPYHKERKMAVQGPRARSLGQRCYRSPKPGFQRPPYKKSFNNRFNNYCSPNLSVEDMTYKIEEKFQLELLAQQEFFEKQAENFHDALKKKIHMLEQRVRTLEASGNEVPLTKARSESISSTPPVHRLSIPQDKIQEATIQATEAISACIEPQIDTQLVFLEHHIEQLNTTSDQLKHLNDSNDHMLHMFGELSRTLHVHDEKNFSRLTEKLEVQRLLTFKTI